MLAADSPDASDTARNGLADLLQKQVALLEADLKPTGLASDRLKIEWRAAKSAHRTAATFGTWLGERVTQVAVAWVLATVFVRFCEDNGLIEYPFIAGPGDRVQLAADLQGKFYENHPESDDLGWLKAAIDALSVSAVAAGLFDKRHNPMWTIEPSPQVIKVLLDRIARVRSESEAWSAGTSAGPGVSPRGCWTSAKTAPSGTTVTSRAR